MGSLASGSAVPHGQRFFVVPKLPFWGAPPAKKEATLAAALRSEGGARGGVVAPLACASEAAGGAPRV